jgi:hypothetical protein
MIKVFLLNFIRQMDFFQVMILIRDYLKKLDYSALKLELQAPEFETRLQAFDDSLKESRKTGKTKRLHELDDLRDEMVQGLYGHVKSQLHFPIPEVAQAAQDLWFILEKHGTKIYDLPVREESGTLAQLLQDLNKPENLINLQTTTSLAWKERMEEYSKQYDDLYSDRTAVEANYEVGRAKAERVKTQAAFTDLCEQINALARVNGAEPYKELADFINRAVDAARITADQRSTVAKNNADKASDTTAQK